MNITQFKNKNYHTIHETDSTNRNIGYSTFENVILVGRNTYNPNVLLYTENILISPYDEKVMSLNKESFYDNNTYDLTDELIKTNVVNEPVFFFIYNFDNYYHFLYDTLPYLYTYMHIKKNHPNLKLLVNYPNKYKKEFYKFNLDILEKIVNTNDLIIHDDNNIYSFIYVSSSLTHGGYSNNEPRNEIYQIYSMITQKCIMNENINKRIYISRRTWINKDVSNIGTNYTTRRKMMNEDELVDKLTQYEFTEIFTENLSIDEKINLFANAEIIIGSIGGGMSNLLFSNKNTKSIIINTPYFLDINYRFKYSLEKSNVVYFNNVTTYTDKNKIPLYCRVKLNDGTIGEIVDYQNEKYLINVSNNDVVGFNNLVSFEQKWKNENDFTLIDNGLNSPYVVDIDELIKIIQKIDN